MIVRDQWIEFKNGDAPFVAGEEEGADRYRVVDATWDVGTDGIRDGNRRHYEVPTLIKAKAQLKTLIVRYAELEAEGYNT